MAFKHKKSWEQKFQELEEYKKEHGNCNIPQRYPPNPSLRQWVANQRQFFKKGQLLDDQERWLEGAEFAFGCAIKNGNKDLKSWRST